MEIMDVKVFYINCIIDNSLIPPELDAGLLHICPCLNFEAMKQLPAPDKIPMPQRLL